jgi:hypothetical protein
MADRYDVTAAHKQMRLAEGNPPLHHLRGAGYDEDAVAILLQLGMLMGLSGILDGTHSASGAGSCPPYEGLPEPFRSQQAR